MDERDLRQLTEEVYVSLLPCLYAAHSRSECRNILEQLGSNDNIVRYYERFVDKPNNMLYILMEYCEGGDLAGVIQRCRKQKYVHSSRFPADKAQHGAERGRGVGVSRTDHTGALRLSHRAGQQRGEEGRHPPS